MQIKLEGGSLTLIRKSSIWISCCCNKREIHSLSLKFSRNQQSFCSFHFFLLSLNCKLSIIKNFMTASGTFKKSLFCEVLPRNALNIFLGKKATFCQIFQGIVLDYRMLISSTLFPGKKYFLSWNREENHYFLEIKCGSPGRVNLS